MKTKNKVVTNLLDNISKARDLLTAKDFNEIYKRVFLFHKIEQDLNIQLSKFTKDSSHCLDFNYNDIKELSQEIWAFIQGITTKFKYSNYLKEIEKNSVITVPILNEFGNNLAKYYLVDTYLRSCYKITSYFALVIYLYEKGYEQQKDKDNIEFNNEITALIRSFL